MTEKLRRPNYKTLEIEITVDDPQAYTVTLVLDRELLDYYCLKNEKDFVHTVGG